MEKSTIHHIFEPFLSAGWQKKTEPPEAAKTVLGSSSIRQTSWAWYTMWGPPVLFVGEQKPHEYYSSKYHKHP